MDKAAASPQPGATYSRLNKKGRITNNATHVGIGPDTFLKAELARVEGCRIGDRCWLVGLSHFDGKDCLKLCPDQRACGGVDSPRHIFSQAFFDYLWKQKEADESKRKKL